MDFCSPGEGLCAEMHWHNKGVVIYSCFLFFEFSIPQGLLALFSNVCLFFMHIVAFVLQTSGFAPEN